jgi:hypothetical protein
LALRSQANFEVTDARQGHVPATFELARDQPVLWVRGIKLAPGPVGGGVVLGLYLGSVFVVMGLWLWWIVEHPHCDPDGTPPGQHTWCHRWDWGEGG